MRNFLLLSHAHFQGTGLEAGPPELKPAPVWNAGATGSGSIHYTTVLVE